MSFRKTLFVVGLTLLCSLSGCNTVQGIGRDITAAGEWGQGR